MRGKVNEELKKNFRPEFLNRLDETIVFPQLSKRRTSCRSSTCSSRACRIV